MGYKLILNVAGHEEIEHINKDSIKEVISYINKKYIRKLKNFKHSSKRLFSKK